MFQTSPSPLAKILEKITDAALLGVLLVAPLFFGGRCAVGQFVFVLLVGIAAVAWVFRQAVDERSAWPKNGAEPILAGGVLLVVLQLLPMPPACLPWFSPRAAELLTVWGETSGDYTLGTWNTVTLNPYQTRCGLTVFVAFVTLYLVTSARIKKVEDAEKTLRWIAVATALMAALGLLQYLTSNGNFLWYFEHPYRTTDGAVKGPFINENHFGHLLALGVAPLIWWIRKHWQAPLEHRRSFGADRGDGAHRLLGFALLGAACLTVFAGLLTHSLGGMAMIVLAAVVCLSVFAARGLLPRYSTVALIFAALVVCAAVTIHGREYLGREMGRLQEIEDTHQLSGNRLHLWKAVATATSEFPLLGSGAGTHSDVYPLYYDLPHTLEFTHAENGYLQVALETGIAGLTLLLTGIGLLGYRVIRGAIIARSPRVVAAMACVAAAGTVSVVHSFVDFVWYLPACMAPTLMLAACGSRLYWLAQGEGQTTTAAPPRPRAVWAMAALGVSVVCGMATWNRLGPALAEPHWHGYLRVVKEVKRQGRETDPTAGQLAEMAQSLEATLAYSPDFPRANLRMATVSHHQFEAAQRNSENNMPLAQIRDAALQSRSHFATPDELKRWVHRAVGQNSIYLDRAAFHAKKAARGCPLMASAYLCLAELSFLDGHDRLAVQRLVDQAVAVGPYQSETLFAAGREKAITGDVQAAIACWRVPYHHDAIVRRQIVQILAGRLSVRDFIQAFEPDLKELNELREYYQGHPEFALKHQKTCRALALAYETAAQNGKHPRPAEAWVTACSYHRATNDPAAALQAARRAAELAPHEYDTRRRLAWEFLALQADQDAIAQLRHCATCNPDDIGVTEALAAALKRQAEMPRTAQDAPLGPRF